MRAPYTLKGCPRCKGDLMLMRDYAGLALECLQCGYSRVLIEHHEREPVPREKHGKAESKGSRLQT